jgi:hypothetical protein
MLAATDWLSLFPRFARSAQFFTDANDFVELLLDDEPLFDDDEEDDELELELDAGVDELELFFLLPQPAAPTASATIASAMSTRFMPAPPAREWLEDELTPARLEA